MRIFAPMATILAVNFAAALPSAADDFPAPAPVVAATVYAEGGAAVTRAASVALPAGRHRILIPYELDRVGSLPLISVSEGAVITQVAVISAAAIDPQGVLTTEQKAARARIDAVQARLNQERDHMRVAKAEIAGLEAQIGFISAVEAPRENDDLALLETLSAHIAQSIQHTQSKIDALHIAAREAQKRQENLEAELLRAEAAFAQLKPSDTEDTIVAVSVEVARATTLEMTLEGIVDAGWHPTYDIDLTTGEAAQISLKRGALVAQRSSMPWVDIALTVSTANLQQALTPSYVESGEASYWEQDMRALSKASGQVAPVAEMAVMESAPMDRMSGSAQNDGVAVRYEFSQPISILYNEGAQLHLDQLEFAAEQTLRAVPHADRTAFFVGSFTNTSGEPILEGQARVLRDGVRVGEQTLPKIVANAQAEVGFGPLETLQIEQIYIETETGDKGVLQRSNRRTQEMVLRLSNLSSDPRAVRAYYGLPFSSQEDLVVRLKSTPEPSESDVEDRKGVSVWDVTLAPNEVKDIKISVEMSWPIGAQLAWRP